MVNLNQNLHKLCDSSELLESSAGLRFYVKIENSTHPAFVIRYSGKPRAYLNECAHQAVELDIIKGNFLDRSGKFIICAAHGALYDPATGKCFGGRCDGRALKLLPVTEINNSICFVAETGIDFISLDKETD